MFRYPLTTPAKSGIKMRRKQNTQSPQASASTNSAIRASDVSTDEESQEKQPESSVEPMGVLTPASSNDEIFQADGAGVQNRRPHQRMESARHRAVVDMLIAEGCVEDGFMESAQAAVGERHGRPPRMWPDAYRVVAADRSIEIYEVECAHPLDAPKLAKIASWATWLQAHGWALRLWRLDSLGGRMEADPATGQMTKAELERVRAAMSVMPGFR